MTTNKINLKAGRFDMTRIPRLRTDFTAEDNVYNHVALNALNARANEQSERIEDLFIQIECDRIDREEAEENTPKKRTKKRRAKKDLFEGIDEATKEELLSEGFELE